MGQGTSHLACLTPEWRTIHRPTEEKGQKLFSDLSTCRGNPGKHYYTNTLKYVVTKFFFFAKPGEKHETKWPTID